MRYVVVEYYSWFTYCFSLSVGVGDASAELVVRSGHCVVFLGKILNSHSAFLYPGVEMGTGELSGNPGKILGGNLAME